MGCMVAGCLNDEVARGLCRYHYDQLRAHGRIDVNGCRARLCLMCGTWMMVRRKSKMFCSQACRKRWQRLKEAGKAPVRDPLPIVVKPLPFDVSDGERMIEDSELFTDRDVLAASDGVCLECGKPVEDDGSLASGWRVPLEAGGRPVLSNRVPLHVECKAKWNGRPKRGRDRKASQQGHR